MASTKRKTPANHWVAWVQTARRNRKHPWLITLEQSADAELGRLRKEAMEGALGMLDELEGGGSLWQIGFWAGRAGLGKSVEALGRRYSEVARGRAQGEALSRAVARVREQEAALSEKEEA